MNVPRTTCVVLGLLCASALAVDITSKFSEYYVNNRNVGPHEIPFYLIAEGTKDFTNTIGSEELASTTLSIFDNFREKCNSSQQDLGETFIVMDVPDSEQSFPSGYNENGCSRTMVRDVCSKPSMIDFCAGTWATVQAAQSSKVQSSILEAVVENVLWGSRPTDPTKLTARIILIFIKNGFAFDGAKWPFDVDPTIYGDQTPSELRGLPRASPYDAVAEYEDLLRNGSNCSIHRKPLNTETLMKALEVNSDARVLFVVYGEQPHERFSSIFNDHSQYRARVYAIPGSSNPEETGSRIANAISWLLSPDYTAELPSPEKTTTVRPDDQSQIPETGTHTFNPGVIVGLASAGIGAVIGVAWFLNSYGHDTGAVDSCRKDTRQSRDSDDFNETQIDIAEL